MTGKPLAITQKQVTAILKGAAKAGVNLKIKAREGEVVFVKEDDEAVEKKPPPPEKFTFGY